MIKVFFAVRKSVISSMAHPMGHFWFVTQGRKEIILLLCEWMEKISLYGSIVMMISMVSLTIQ